MAMDRAVDRQGDVMVSWAALPRSPGHVFYDRLQEVLIAGRFDRFVEAVCQPCYAAKAWRRRSACGGLANRARLGSGIGKQAMRRQAEIVDRSFAHNRDRGGLRRTRLRGRDNVHKRYRDHGAGHNLGILMRLPIGAGTPKEAAARGLAYLFLVYTEEAMAIILVAAPRDGFAILVMAIPADPD